MRVLLDVHLSGRVLGPPLQLDGHDVLALDQHPGLRRMKDAEILQFALSDRRVTVSCNVKDFAGLAHECAADGRQHSGCLLLVGVDHGQFGTILRILAREFAAVPSQDAWQNRVVFAGSQDA